MSPLNIHLVAETLPSDILSRIDEQFYNFVREILGKSFSDLLEILQINSATCFLMTDDFLEILNMNIDHQNLIDLNKSICFRLTDGSTVIKPGRVAGFKCFKEALLNKREMVMKYIRKIKRPLHESTTTNEQSSSPLFSPMSTPLETTSQPLSQENSLMISSASHKESIVQSMNRWCQENKLILGFTNLKLTDEGVDFTSHFTWNDQNEISCEITCRCGITVKLSIKDNRFQSSNFYKHLRQTSCSDILRLKELQQKQSNDTTIHQTSATSLFHFNLKCKTK